MTEGLAVEWVGIMEVKKCSNFVLSIQCKSGGQIIFGSLETHFFYSIGESSGFDF